MISRFGVMSCLCLSVCISSTKAAMVILNGGFETGQLAPWLQGANHSNPNEPPENWNVTATDAHTGIYSATDVGNIELRQTFAPIATSLISEISLWVKQPFGPSISSVYFHFTTGSSQFNRLDTTSTGWQSFDITSRLPAGKMLTGVSFYGYSYGYPVARTYMDDFVVRSVPEPASIGLFALIAMALCADRPHRDNAQQRSRGAPA